MTNDKNVELSLWLYEPLVVTDLFSLTYFVGTRSAYI